VRWGRSGPAGNCPPGIFIFLALFLELPLAPVQVIGYADNGLSVAQVAGDASLRGFHMNRVLWGVLVSAYAAGAPSRSFGETLRPWCTESVSDNEI